MRTHSIIWIKDYWRFLVKDADKVAIIEAITAVMIPVMVIAFAVLLSVAIL